MEEQQSKIEPGSGQGARRADGIAERGRRFVPLAFLRQGDRDVVEGEGVIRLEVYRGPVRCDRVGSSSELVEHHTPLIPEFRNIGLLRHKCFVQIEGSRVIGLEEVNLGHGVEHGTPIPPLIQGKSVLPQGIGIVALLAERLAQVDMRLRFAFRGFDRFLLADLERSTHPTGDQPLEGQIRLRTPKRRIEFDSPLRRRPRLVVTTDLSEEEGNEVMGLGVVGVQIRRALQRLQRLGLLALVIKDLTEIEVTHGAVGLELHHAPEACGRAFEIAPLFFG